ncbi:2OG-Fe(II) oxygenase [Polaromonas sp.]|uniref:2OG-Fe(II) oxygenase n=1 Tax=Polaromonas sp. TaxID=1869339 RepID=UPI003267EBC6
MHFLNRSERFKAHELDLHWYYPIVFAEKPFTEDVEPRLLALDDTLQVVTECWNRIKNALGYPVRLYECMLTANTYGTEGQVHQDIVEEEYRPDHVTALVYCNKKWDIAWAGETLFFDEDDEITVGVMPKSGRVVIAEGDPKHVGRSVSKICPSDRRVLVFKFWRLDGQTGINGL